MEDSSESSCSALRLETLAEANSDTQRQQQQQAGEGKQEEEEELEEKPMCSADCHKTKKRFTVKKWNAVAMWAWGKT